MSPRIVFKYPNYFPLNCFSSTSTMRQTILFSQQKYKNNIFKFFWHVRHFFRTIRFYQIFYIIIIISSTIVSFSIKFPTTPIKVIKLKIYTSNLQNYKSHLTHLQFHWLHSCIPEIELKKKTHKRIQVSQKNWQRLEETFSQTKKQNIKKPPIAKFPHFWSNFHLKIAQYLSPQIFQNPWNFLGQFYWEKKLSASALLSLHWQLSEQVVVWGVWFFDVEIHWSPHSIPLISQPLKINSVDLPF